MKAKKLTKETVRDLGVTKRTKFDMFRVGDTIEIDQRVVEGEKSRIQKFTGDVIAIHNNGISSTFTVRRIGVHGIAVERILPYHSPLVEAVRLVTRGQVRRAKLYYLRKRIGKAAVIEKKEQGTRSYEQAEEVSSVTEHPASEA